MTELSYKQRIAFDKIKSRQNVCILGPGGSGKSMLIRFIYGYFKSKNISAQVCALTGCAANLLACEARTVHSWAGIGIANGTIEKIVEKIRAHFPAKKAWLTTRVLIIDEISMMSKKMFNLLDFAGRTIRHNERVPFGGIQVIFVGDFFQLPPIGSTGEGNEDSGKFCFESDRWYETFSTQNHVLFDKVFRQQNDTEYITILNQIRQGVLKKKSYECLIHMLSDYPNKMEKLRKEAEESETTCIYPTRLYPTKRKTTALNNEELDKLPGETVTYKLTYNLHLPTDPNNKTYSDEAKRTELGYLKTNIMCEQELRLKIGAQVMCVVNNTAINKFNGSRGIITGFTVDNIPVVTFMDGMTTPVSHHTWESEKIPGIGVVQIPLILSWAVTIHKSQGVTLDCAEIDVGKDIFECGQTYVAMSRIKSLAGLYLKSFQCEQIKTNKKVQEFHNQLTGLQSEDNSDCETTPMCVLCFNEINCDADNKSIFSCGHATHTRCSQKRITIEQNNLNTTLFGKNIHCPVCRRIVTVTDQTGEK